MGVLATLSGATPHRRIVKICVDGAAQAEWDVLLAELDEAVAQDSKAGSLAAERTTEKLEQMEAVRERIAASEVSFEVEQLDWTARVALQAAHPPRKDNFIDQVRGYNVETYQLAVVRGSTEAVEDVNGDRATEIPDDTWDALLGRGKAGDEDYVKGALNAKDVDKLVRAAIDANDGETTVPPSARSLLVSQDSGASLAQPGPGTSPRSGSAGGSRRGSAKSRTTKKAASSR